MQYVNNLFIQCRVTLCRVLLSDCTFDNISAASSTFGPVFFIAYVMTMYFILIHMFLAIINATYQIVKSELAYKESFHVIDLFKKVSPNNLFFVL